MNHADVQLIGVFDPDGIDEGFCYSVDAPRNLWIGALTAEGTRMGHQFMSYILNTLIEDDCFNPGQWAEVIDQAGACLRATVMKPVPAHDVKAYAAETRLVLPVSVKVVQ